MIKLVNISLFSTAATYIFVFIYYRLLTILNGLFPAKMGSNFLPDTAQLANPEPFEIPLYLILIVMTVIFLIIISHFKYKIALNIKLILLVIFSFLLIRRFGTFPMANSPFPYTFHQPALIMYSFLIIFIATIFLTIIEITIFEKLLKNTRYHRIIFILIIAIIGFFVFEPSFPISWHDYSYFMGPILEIGHGRTIYTEVMSQYGFLSIQFFAFLNSVNLLPVSYLPFIIWGLYIVEYSLCFYLIYHTSRSLILGLLGLFSIITINYYSLCHLPNSYPQVGPFRWLPIIILIIIFLKIKKIDSKLMIFFTSLFSFWIIDVGIAIILSYLFTLFIFYLNEILNLKRTIKAICLLIINLITIFVVINIIQLIFGYKTINIIEIFSKTQQYASAGFGMIPIDPSSYLWLIIFIYFVSIILFLYHQKLKFVYQLLIVVGNFSFITAVYYVGRSHPHNLLNIATIPIVNIFLIFGIIFKQINNNKIRALASLIIFIIFITIPAYYRKDGVARNVFAPNMNIELKNFYQKDQQLINQYFPEKQILILSSDDTYLLYLTNKSSLLNINPQTGIVTKQDLDFALKKTLQICPKKIVVDCKTFNSCPGYNKLNYALFDSKLVLNQLNKKCKLEYKPIKCTSHICIAEGTNIL